LRFPVADQWVSPKIGRAEWEKWKESGEKTHVIGVLSWPNVEVKTCGA